LTLQEYCKILSYMVRGRKLVCRLLMGILPSDWRNQFLNSNSWPPGPESYSEPPTACHSIVKLSYNLVNSVVRAKYSVPFIMSRKTKLYRIGSSPPPGYRITATVLGATIREEICRKWLNCSR